MDPLPEHAGARELSIAALTPDGGGAAAAAQFVPGFVFSGRYRMITELGRGGMGAVWQADDLVLQLPVALKLIRSASEGDRARILNEVRLARQITHPAVCRVFDVGESVREVFYTMELVQGEDLATLLRRVGRLPSEKVADIARQLSGGLAAAHAQGVLHRDLKPANIVIDQDGQVRITDFGIATSRDQADDAPASGTPGYMAPEQVVRGGPLSEQTDLFALGVVLYELLVGQRPFAEGVATTAPPRPSTLVPDVNPQLERAIMRALSIDPRRRPASAGAMAELTDGATMPRGRPWIAGAALAGLATLLVVLFPTIFPRGARALTDQDSIVLADFLNTTGEPVFDGTLKVALAVALEQSPFLKIVPDDRVRETLRLMQRPADEPLTRSLAREVAQRERLKALVAGSIGTLGSHYVLAVEAINAETGDMMAREQLEVPAKEQVLTSIGVAASTMRQKLGESLASIQRFDVALPRATTPSLEALHAYSLALDQGRANPRIEALPHLERAIELDPDFALAHALISGVYANTGRSVEAPAFSRKAFDLRDRVSERERFIISWRYYLDAEQAWDKALSLSQSWTATYPREAFAFNSLGMSSSAFGQHGLAVGAFKEAIRLDAQFVPPYGNLVGALIASNRFDEAKTLVRDAGARGIDAASLRRAGYLLAFLNNDRDAMGRALSAARTSNASLESYNWEARTNAFAGRFKTAHALFQNSARAAARQNLNEVAAQWTMEDAESQAVAGHCADARDLVSAGLDLGRDNFTLERAARVLALCRAFGEASGLAGELSRRFSTATLTTRIHLPVIAAAAALARSEPGRALELLDPVKPYDQAPAAEFWPCFLRGQAYLQLKDGRAASAQFQMILDRRGAAPTSPLYALAHLGLAQGAALAGDLGQARRGYQALFALWNEADPDIEPLNNARREYARLQ
jgi:Tfp pilus assembly protein PilF